MLVGGEEAPPGTQPQTKGSKHGITRIERRKARERNKEKARPGFPPPPPVCLPGRGGGVCKGATSLSSRTPNFVPAPPPSIPPLPSPTKTDIQRGRYSGLERLKGDDRETPGDWEGPRRPRLGAVGGRRSPLRPRPAQLAVPPPPSDSRRSGGGRSASSPLGAEAETEGEEGASPYPR